MQTIVSRQGIFNLKNGQLLTRVQVNIFRGTLLTSWSVSADEALKHKERLQSPRLTTLPGPWRDLRGKDSSHYWAVMLCKALY